MSMNKCISNMKIKDRLIASYLLVLVLMLVLSITSIFALNKTKDRLSSFINKEAVEKETVLSTRVEINSASRIIRDMLIDTNPANFAKSKEKFNESIVAINENLSKLKELNGINPDILSNYDSEIQNWLSIGDSIVKQIEAGNLPQASTMLLQQCTPTLEKLAQTSIKLTDDVNLRAEQTIQNNLKIVNSINMFTVFLLVVAVILSVLISLIVTKSIVVPIRELSNVSENLSKGILDTNITYSSKDEIGAMADSMRASMNKLSMYISDIDKALETLAKGDFNITRTEPFVGDFENIEKSFTKFIVEMSATISKINGVSEQVAIGSQQVLVGAQELAQGATEQSSSVDDLSNIINSITEDINLNAKNAQEANILANRAGQSLVNSNEKMRQMIIAMTDISEKSNEISKIIKTIDDIAFQTNILALNAAVEAARAGSAGKGFAVVADEVRNLAQKSAEAAQNTTALIEGTVEAVKNGSLIADETAKSLLEIVEDSTRTTEMMINIAEASEKQAQAANHIRETISEISSVVQINSATAEESSAASEELSMQSKALKELVGGFTLLEITEK